MNQPMDEQWKIQQLNEGVRVHVNERMNEWNEMVEWWGNERTNKQNNELLDKRDT